MVHASCFSATTNNLQERSLDGPWLVRSVVRPSISAEALSLAAPVSQVLLRDSGFPVTMLQKLKTRPRSLYQLNSKMSGR
jgi:hypothetical protein